jgi:hypothetical protein
MCPSILRHMNRQRKRAKRRRQNVQCPICDRMFSGQGLSGHMRFVHHMPATVISKKLPKAKIKIRPPEADERTPYLVKPVMSYEELVKRVHLDIELLDYKQPSPCCGGVLRSAKRYHQEPDLKKPIGRLDGRMFYKPKLTHLIKEDG